MGISSAAADAVINRLVRDQFGVVHRRQLLAEGVSYRQLDGRTDSGALIELAHGVYTVSSAPATFQRQYKAAELAVPDAAIGGLAAAKWHDLGATRSAAPEIVVHPSSNHRCGLARVSRRRDVRVTTVQGIRVTDVPQTLVDLTGRLRLSKLEEVWTSAIVRDRTTLEALEERVAAAERQRLRHRGLARALIDSLVEGAGLAESELEALLHDLAAQVPGIPEIVRQVPLPWWKAGAGRGDLGVPAWRMILEADGRSWHARLRDFDVDRMRDNVAAANGHVVLRFGALHLKREPDHVVELITAAGAHRRAA